MITELTNQNLNDELKENLVLVDFYAVWCGPCKMMHPIIEEIARQYSELKVIKIDVDKHEDLSKQYGIMSIPTLILFKKGNLVEKNVGFTPKEQLEQWIDNNK